MITSGYFVFNGVLILFILILFLLLRKIRHASKYMKNIPGPPPIFPIGSTWDFIGGSTVLLPTFMKYLDKYGDTIVVNDGAFSRILCTIDHDLLGYFYNSTEHITKADQYSYLQSWLGDGLLTSTGSKWRAHRKVITTSFHFSILKDFVVVFETVGNKLIKQLRKEAGKDSVKISEIISSYALDVICEAAMGIKINTLEGENSIYIKNIKAECAVAVERQLTPLHNIFYPLTWKCYREKRALKVSTDCYRVVGWWHPTIINISILSASARNIFMGKTDNFKVIHSYVEDVINQKINQKESNRIDDHSPEFKSGTNGGNKRLAFLDLLLQAEIDGKPLSKDELRDEVNTFMFEGHDTTSSAINFCLLMIATHPEVQDKVLQEQLEIFNSDIKNVNPSFSQLYEMKYLELVIKETLRLFPSVPYFGRRLTKDTEYKGVLYPKGLGVMLFPFAVHRSPKYFPEPEKFIPERFKDKSTKLPYSYTPFSAGPRNCIGQKFAMLEMISVLSKIVRHFELGPAIPEHKIQLAPELILISKNGVRISIKNRIL